MIFASLGTKPVTAILVNRNYSEATASRTKRRHVIIMLHHVTFSRLSGADAAPQRRGQASRVSRHERRADVTQNHQRLPASTL